MRVEFLAENIEPFLSLLTKALPTHSPVPILTNILIEATATHVSLSATNLELGIKIKLAAKIEEEGALTVPGKQFIEVMSSIQTGNVELSQMQDTCVLHAKGNKIVFQTIPKEEFPQLFEERGEKIYSFTKEEFQDIFSKLIFVVSVDESRPNLTGVYISQKDTEIDFVATDGFRMALKRVHGKQLLSIGEGIIVSSKLISELLSLKENETIDMYLYKEGNQVLFETLSGQFIGRIIEGQYPNYEKVIPVAHTTKIIFDKDEFLHAIRLSSVFAKDSANITHLKIDDNIVYMHSRTSGIGEGEIKIEVEKTGDNNEIAFNVKYLMDLLRSVGEKHLSMTINSALEPALFTLEKDPEFMHVIMPVRVQE